MDAMILAAGRGKRMMPLSATTPKPLLALWGRPLIEWQMLCLKNAGINRAVVNTAYLGAQIVDWLTSHPVEGFDVDVSIEGNTHEEALETLGGIVRALPLLTKNDDVFLVTSGDIATDFPYASLRAAADVVRSGKVDAHLVLVPNPDFHRDGDMAIRNGLVTRKLREYTYANIGIFSSRIFRGVPAEKAPLFPWLYQYADRDKISGEIYEGSWANVGTPGELEKLNRMKSFIKINGE